MDDREIEELMEDVASVMKSLISSAVSPLHAEIERLRDVVAVLEKSIPDAESLVRTAREGLVGNDRMESVERTLDETRSALPDPVDVDGILEQAKAIAIDAAAVAKAAVLQSASEMIGEAVAAIPPAEPRKDADVADVIEQVLGRLAPDFSELRAAIGAIPAPVELPDIPAMVASACEARIKDGFKALELGLVARTPSREAVEQLVREQVGAAVAALPKPEDGKSVTVDDVAPMVKELVSATVSEAVASIPPPKDGAPGKLPVVKSWEDRVYYEGECATHDGSTYQALKDTGRMPGANDDWICIAARGGDGKNADEIEVRGTYDPEADYRRLNIVALNGAAFIARKDDPDTCPGEDWQVIAMRGKPGQKGDTVKGDPGKKGDPGPGVLHLGVNGEGMLTLVNGDGTTVECDLYPLLSKLGGAA